MTFDELALDPRVLEAVKATGYTTPTPIQEQAIPPALEGRDVLGIAQTGTGKTASFSLPMITRLAKGRARARMPRSLVLCPTRELAAQVAENFESYSKGMKLNMALLIGGVSFGDQDKKIDRGVDVLIATPGRLLDHFGRGKLMLNGIDIMVVDEADRMLDMGFIPDIEKIFSLTPFTRQTLFFSATMAPEIQRITDTFLQNPVMVKVEQTSKAADTVAQSLHHVESSRKDGLPGAKRQKLRDLIVAEGDSVTNAIIFCNRKRDISTLHRSLEKHGMDVASLHGDLDQRVRMQTLDAFRDGKVKLLVASDVAARGLDIPDVSHVFNFDVPTHSEDYVHRIGRTGRAGRSGKAFTLTTKPEQKYLDNIEKMLGGPIPVGDAAPVPVPEVADEIPSEPKDVVKKERTKRVSRGRSSRRGEEVGKDDARRDETDKPEVGEEVKAVEPKAEAAVEPVVADEKPERRARRGNRGERDQEKPRGRENRNSGNNSNNTGGRGPRGLGDHMPAFMLIPLPDLTKRKSADGDDGSVADAA